MVAEQFDKVMVAPVDSLMQWRPTTLRRCRVIWHVNVREVGLRETKFVYGEKNQMRARRGAEKEKKRKVEKNGRTFRVDRERQ